MEIRIQNLKKTFGEKVAVNIDNYVINSGDMLGLVGNNGAGKSTLFRLIMDLIKSDSGNVTMVGTYQDIPVEMDVTTSEDWKEWTGAFIDDSFLIDYLTPDEYFHFVAKICGISNEQLEEHLAHYEHFMNGEVIGQKKLIRNLSAGNKQKVGIIAAMIQQPQILILDEATSALDTDTENMVLQNIVSACPDKTCIVSTHRPSILKLSNRVYRVEDKKLVVVENTNEKDK